MRRCLLTACILAVWVMTPGGMAAEEKARAIGEILPDLSSKTRGTCFAR